MRRISLLVALVVLGFVGNALPAAAQECGDADGSGSVGVSDGVQTLRAAAGLESLCTAAVCDIDGSGAITVTDGVSVLRKAAGLVVDERCDGLAGQPATVLKELQPLLKFGVGFATGTPVTSCANGADGEIEVTTDADGTDTSFFACQVDQVELFGNIIVGPSLLTFSVFEADTVGDEDFISDFDGELTLGSAGGGARSLTGPVDVTTESAGVVTLTFNNVIVSTGVLTGGSITVDLLDSDIADSFTSMVLTFDGSGSAAVTATQAGGGTANFRLDIATGATS